MLWYLLQDLHMYLSLPFLTQLCDGKFSDLHSNDESPFNTIKTNDTEKKLL